MKAVEHIIFLIHPCIYEAIDADKIHAENFGLFLERERTVKRRWLDAIPQRPASTLFAQLGGPESLQAAAADHLGQERALFFRTLYSQDKGLREYYGRLTAELHAHLRAHDLEFDPATATSELWGESFEGCVPGYGGAFAEHLGLHVPPKMHFEMTVFDAKFLHRSSGHEVIPIPDSDVEAWLFRCHDTTSAVTFQPRLTAQWLDHRRVSLMLDDRRVQACTKLGHTVWPETPWRKGKPEQVLPFDMALSDFCFHWIRCTGLAYDDFRQVITAARVTQTAIETTPRDNGNMESSA